MSRSKVWMRSARPIEEYTPDVVAIELDPSRFQALKRQAADPTVTDVLEVKNFNSLLVQWLLAYLQRKIGFDVGVEPGAEMKAAIEEAEKRGIAIALVDRDIRLTLLRFWNSLGIFEKIRMFWALIISIAEVDSGQQIDIESLKDQDVIDVVMEEFRKFSPNGARALIDERDAFIAHQLVLLKAQRPEGKILAVVGAGHRQGISGYLDNPATLPAFDSLVGEPKSLPWGKIFGFAVTGLFVFLLAAIGFSGVGLNVLLEAFLFWVIIHGVLVGAFCPARRRPPVLCAHLFLRGMDDLPKPDAPCRLDRRLCGSPGAQAPDHRFPEDLRDRVARGDGKDPALQGGPCRRAGKPRQPARHGPVFHLRIPGPRYRPGVVISTGSTIWVSGQPGSFNVFFLE